MAEINLNNDEIEELKLEINSLLEANRYLKGELEKKEMILQNVLREKDQLTYDLKKQKRSNLNLKQQLEDERAYYMNEKEHYCHEMVETKRVQKKNGEKQKRNDERQLEIEYLRNELKTATDNLSKHLEANYNLCVKFLRMKNTIYSLKSRFKVTKRDQIHIITDLQMKLKYLKEELNYLISDKFRETMPPSNKKYLSMVKCNNQLIYDNIYLQMELSKMHNEIERIKGDRIKFETIAKLPYSQSRSSHKLKKLDDKYVQVNTSDFENYCETESSRDSYADIEIDYKPNITPCKIGHYSPPCTAYNFNMDQYASRMSLKTQSSPNLFSYSNYQSDEEDSGKT